MKNKETLIKNCQVMIDRGNDLESIISFLRKKGCGKLDSILILSKTKSLSFEQAKNLVHFSQTWKDRRAKDDDLQDKFLDFLEQIDLRKF